MKLILSLSFLLFVTISFSQKPTKIYLCDTLNEERMGIWTIGKFKIYVGLDLIEKRLRSDAENYKNSGQQDSIFAITARRCFKAADELKNAENGFNLQLLVVYYGLENETLYTGNSPVVSDIVRGLVLQGLAVIYKNDLRIDVLTRKESKVKYKHNSSKTIIYYKHKKNVIYEWTNRRSWF
jgi:hypothetical protein